MESLDLNDEWKIWWIYVFLTFSHVRLKLDLHTFAIYMVGVFSDAVEATSTPEEPESLVDKFVVEEIVSWRNGQAIQMPMKLEPSSLD